MLIRFLEGVTMFRSGWAPAPERRFWSSRPSAVGAPATTWKAAFATCLDALPVRLLVSIALMSPVAAGAAIIAIPDRADGVYFPGETVLWTLRWEGTRAPPESPRFVVKAGGLTELSSGNVVWVDGDATIKSPIKEPSTVLLEVSWDEEGKRQVARSGAVAAPNRIAPAEPEPADFDEFWAAKRAELAAVPANPQLEPGESGREGVEYCQVVMQNILGTRIQGQLARPAVAEKFPALLRLQGAGVYGLQKSWVTDRAAEGWLALNILPHDLPIDEPDGYRMEKGWLPALKKGLPAPVALDRNEDHARLLELLGVTSIRPGADPNKPDSPNAPNTDEARANPYPDLPDPLVTDAGEPVRTPDQWWGTRRPEIMEHFEREIYGRIPDHVPDVAWEVLSVTKEEKGGVAVLTKRLAGHVDNSAYPFLDVTIDLTLSTPSEAAGPVPVMLHFGWPAAILARFPQAPGPAWDEQVLAHGWAAATIVPASYQADNGEGLTQGIIGLANHGRPRTPDQWGALRAWAWGASRALDYFETDPAVDARQAGIEGLSRYGKAAAVAMAFDQRFAIGFIGSSGKGGLALHRRDFGERVENLAGSGAYHWMAGSYLKYAGPLAPGDLPVDSHELIALFAPRPAFVSAGAPEVEGQWIDQRGTFLAAVAAAPVYELFEKRGLGTEQYPGTGPALVDGELAWRQHEGGHTTLPNWPAFLAWADHYLSTPTEDRWVATWVTAQQLTEPHNEPPEPGFAAATVRQKFRTSIGGKSLRVRFSNDFGDAPLTLDGASIALSAGDGAIVADSSRSLTFRGEVSVTIQPGAQWISDVVDFAPPPMADLAVTLRTTAAPDGLTGHPGSRTTSYFSYNGEPVDVRDMTGSTHVDHWYFVSGVDVLSDQGAAAIAILGDSITDGRGSTTNGNDRWPDRLSQRLRDNPATARVAVLNQGIGGNRVLRDGLGPHALARLDRDVIAQPGGRWLIVLEGINDIGTAAGDRAEGRPAATAADVIASYDQTITRAHDDGIKVYGATIMPFGGSFYFSEQGEADRQAINNWIRHSGRYDGVIDFDLVARDPSNPSMLRTELDTGDHLHLNAAGLKAIADAIDLSLFEN